MSETSGLWTTGGATGDQVASYSQVVLSRYSEILAACSGFEGVAPGYRDELAASVTGANTVQIATGGAVVDGKFYECSAAENINIPNATAGNTRIDRIVLRADWAGFKVALHRIAGTDAGSPVPPAITQTSGTTYDIMLYQATVTDAGVVTLTTDERVFAAGGTNSLSANAVETAKILNGAVTEAKLGTGAVTPAKTSFFSLMGSSAYAVYAMIESNGTVISASTGITCTRFSAGDYEISGPPNDTNIVLATVHPGYSASVIKSHYSFPNVHVDTYDLAGARADTRFSVFIICRVS